MRRLAEASAKCLRPCLRLSAMLALALFIWWPRAGDVALAQSCTLSVANEAFGSIDVTANTSFDTTATLTVTCSGLILLPVQVCISLGPGSAGANSPSDRLMASGGNQLHYGLFTDAARSIPFGSYVTPSFGTGVTVTLPIGGGTVMRTVYGRVAAGQQTLPAGSYLSSFSGVNAEIQYGLTSGLLGCNLLTSTSTASFNATASVTTTCRVTTSNLNFGAVGVIAANSDASTNLGPVCTNGTPYTIGLDGGLSGATNPTQRKMTNGAPFVLYGLYQDAARSQAFGNTIGTNTVGGTGTGLSQTVSVFGRVAPQATPAPGTYSDTITVTLTF
ncbi:Spore coat protein U (SCPU) domain-containing protein [Rhizobiales bacterium GAS188]|nr:Spore coat protein U (SCPU) domain-containing protein [Rhizobiales bacterium GAS188]